MMKTFGAVSIRSSTLLDGDSVDGSNANWIKRFSVPSSVGVVYTFLSPQRKNDEAAERIRKRVMIIVVGVLS